MSHISLKSICYVCLLALVGNFSASQSFAENREIELNVNGNFSPEGSVGLLIVNGKVIQKPITKQDSINDETLLVTMPADSKDIKDGSVATAVLFGPEGQTAFADVKQVTDAFSSKSFYTIPDCRVSPKIVKETSDDLGYLQRLAEFRSARREGQQLLLAKKLDPQFIEKIRRLEKRLWFSILK